VRLRGLDPAYTQILINGEQVPGAGSGSGTFGNGAEGAFFVDRIPAELIERVEIVRGASANRSGDAVAGTINIVLRDAFALDGGFVRAGVLYWPNSENFGETLGGVFGTAIGEGRILLGANMQDRHNPKDKFSARFAAPGAPLDNIEDQTDVRDGTDYAANFAFEHPFAGGELALDGFFVRTDRTEDEDSIEFRQGIRNDANLLTINDNNVEIEQTSVSLNAEYEVELFGGETEFRVGYATFDNSEIEFEDEIEFLRDAVPFPEGDRYTGEDFSLDIQDTEWTVKLNHEAELEGFDVEFGIDAQTRTRDSLVQERAPRIRVNLPAGFVARGAFPTGATLPPEAAFSPVTGGDLTIERRRFDPFVMFSGETENEVIDWEVGLRLETTTLDITDRTVGAQGRSVSYENVLPSVNLRWNASDNDRFHLSVARTLRNPSFSFLSPATLEAELGDNDFRGNPELEPETANGLDVGYERRVGEVGVVGVNVFYRQIDNLIEVFSTGVVGSEGPGTFVYSARNTGDGEVMGIEFDLSTPLSAIGLPDTGVFLNYSWLDSSVNDEFGERRFNDQVDFVLNVGFIHEITATGSAFGVTYREQGSAFSRVLGQEITTTYGGDLEVFVEQAIGDSFTVRLTGSNLLDSSKDETFDNFVTAADQRARAFDEFEFESETAGPIFQLIGRYAF
jgi:outer membrane receptor protein involved in Fe transport